LAQETRFIVFIDNGRPYNYCKGNNILIANLLEFMLFLYAEQKLTKKEIYVKINLIRSSVPTSYLKEIDNYL
jgi:hypothetical protein